MDNGITAGLNLLNKMLDAEPNAEAKSDKLDVDAMLKNEKKHKGRKKHFKITQTHVTEGEMIDENDNENNSFIEHKEVKHKKWNCFGSCTRK